MSTETKTKNRRASIDDVAKHAGVSTATVSRVVNQTGPVAADTISRVQQAIVELNYRPQAAARNLAGRRTHTIGLLVSSIAGDFFAPMLRGIEATAQENGFTLLVYSTGGGAGNISQPLPLGEQNTDGILSFVDSISDAELTHLADIGFPTVLIHQSPPTGLNIPFVTIENKQGARKLVDHLIEVHNYRRIAFLRGEEGHEDSYWREMGYRESLRAHDILLDENLIAAGGFDRNQARNVVESWLNAGIDMDAIFAADDESALGVLTALQSAGLCVSQDMAVVGFDDISMSCYLTPPLTTVRAPIEDVGRTATQQLINLIRGEASEPLLLLPTEVIIRQSCGCDG
jgi:LacI family transcriptional regulator